MSEHEKYVPQSMKDFLIEYCKMLPCKFNPDIRCNGKLKNICAILECLDYELMEVR